MSPTISATEPPEVLLKNLFLEDSFGQRCFRLWFGPQNYAAFYPHLETIGAGAAKAKEQSAQADIQSPWLQVNEGGQNAVHYNPAYQELEKLAYESGLVSLKYDPTFRAQFGSCRHLAGFALGYYFAQTDIGVYCPVCMTDGVAAVLEHHASAEVIATALPRLSSASYESLWQGAMLLTERQAGSDVGACALSATSVDGNWMLHGEKWFCSNADAEAMLVVARMPEGIAGTAGLGLFLVLREGPGSDAASIEITRLKPKLGVRSMPTGEITFRGTPALLIGGAEQGFRQMTEMLNLSRLYNAIASVAGMRRAVVEATEYGKARNAFGKKLVDLPLWRASMLDIIAEQVGAFLIAFEAVRAFDEAEQGNAEASALSRLLIPVVKAYTGKLSVAVVSECIEAIGGNAYIEDSIMPRLLRDCQVLPIWEGTTNVLCLDLLRVLQKTECEQAFFNRIDALLTLAQGTAIDTAWTAAVRARSTEDRAALLRIRAATADEAQRLARPWMETASRTMVLALLLRHAAESECREVCSAAFLRLRARPYACMPVACSDSRLPEALELQLLSAGGKGKSE